MNAYNIISIVTFVLFATFVRGSSMRGTNSKRKKKGRSKWSEQAAIEHMDDNRFDNILGNDRRLLCTVFFQVQLLFPSQDTAYARAAANFDRNIRLLSPFCDFALVSYTCFNGAHKIVQGFNNVVLYSCNERFSNESDALFFPKPAYYEQLLGVLPFYDLVWLIDDATDLSNFKPEMFFKAVLCSFWPDRIPLVLHPLIGSNNHDHEMLNSKYWDKTSRKYTASGTDFVPLLSPMMDARYFDWLTRYVAGPLSNIFSRYAISSLLETLVCRSAALFLERYYLVEDPQSYSCALITTPGTKILVSPSKKRRMWFARNIEEAAPTFYSWRYDLRNGTYIHQDTSNFQLIEDIPDRCPPSKILGNFKNFPASQDRIQLRNRTLQKFLSGPVQLIKLPPQKNQEHASSDKSSKSSRGNDDILNTLLTSIQSSKMTKVYALYFPQYHSDPMNDRLWGANYTDWDRVVSSPYANRKGNRIIKPSELGYYDLMDRKTRQVQGELAKAYGIDGFVYHHYWFYDPSRLGATLAAPLEAMLKDGAPAVEFALHWCTHDWTRTWQGKGVQPGEMLQQQFYPPPNDPMVAQHYSFLSRFFHHPNYIRVGGAPLFMVFCFMCHVDQRVMPILQKLRELAIADGFPSPGLHIPQFWVNTEHVTASEITGPLERPQTTQMTAFDGNLYYPSNHNYMRSTVPGFCLTGKRGPETRPVYLSTITAFDNTPRRGSEDATVWNRLWTKRPAEEAYMRDLVDIIMYEMCCQDEGARAKGGKFVLINAWNEWAEGMVLEPSDVHGRSFLEATAQAKQIAESLGCDWRKYEKLAPPPIV